MNHEKMRHVVLTGVPGIGKTTLVKRVCDKLKKNNVALNGFFTEEIRDEKSRRVGFRIITMDGISGLLSHINSKSSVKVGQYGVEVKEFESVALPAIKKSETKFLVIDEIGKMELFSEEFKATVKKAFDSDNIRILATIPVQKGKGIPFVESIRNNKNAQVFTVEKSNRDSLEQIILQTLLY